MQRPQLRQRQLITTFGPGAMTDLPERSVLIAGLDAWVGNGGVINEPRLAAKIASVLGVESIELRRPPEAEEEGGGFVRSYIFPLWFVTQDLVTSQAGWRTRYLVHWTALEKKGRKWRKPDGNTSSLTPVRFVRACRLGHLGDIDWLKFVHGKSEICIAPQLFLDERGTSGDLGETWVRCSCKQERPMSQAADPKSGALGLCDGGRPWLGQGKVADEKCNEPNRLLVRAASNAWLPQPWRVISLPQRDVKAREAVDSVWSFLEAAEGIEEVAYERKKPTVSQALHGFTNEEAWEAIQARKGTGSEDKPVKRVELETLISSNLGENKSDSVFLRSRTREVRMGQAVDAGHDAIHSVWVCGYRLFDAREIFKDLARPGLRVRMLLDVGAGKGTEHEIVTQFLQTFKERHWPEYQPVPEIWYDPKALLANSNERAVAHAKCVIADEHWLFVSSANFTDAALTRNLEAGVLIDSHKLARQMESYLEGLIREGRIRAAAGKGSA